MHTTCKYHYSVASSIKVEPRLIPIPIRVRFPLPPLLLRLQVIELARQQPSFGTTGLAGPSSPSLQLLLVSCDHLSLAPSLAFEAGFGQQHAAGRTPRVEFVVVGAGDWKAVFLGDLDGWKGEKGTKVVVCEVEKVL